MAVDGQNTSTGSTGRRMKVGTNVVVSVVLVVGIVVAVQAMLFSTTWRWDMTSTGINSLSEGTENLLRDIDSPVRITSLYFETDREEKDQPRYRRAAKDLVELYEATNRSKITAECINPLKERDKLRAVIDRLHEIPTFKKALEAYRKPIATYQDDLDGRMRTLVDAEIKGVRRSMGGGLSGGSSSPVIARIEPFLLQINDLLERTRKNVDELTGEDNRLYAAAKTEILNLYQQVSKALKDIGHFGQDQAGSSADPSSATADFLSGASGRFAELVADVEAEITTLEELEPLALDSVLGQLEPTGNAILVETEDNALVVEFSAVWPPTGAGGNARPGFEDRAFKGEEKLTSAILRATHREQTAVVFVRFGGPPMFMGGFMPGQPPAPYSTMKSQLEEANFVVKEWDLKTTKTPPVVDPAPTRMLFVVMRPSPPRRDPMGRPSQEPPFSDVERQALMTAMGEDGRALFIAGWTPGPMGPIPAPYEYADYLSKTWGIGADFGTLLIETTNVKPGQYVVQRQDFNVMDKVEVHDHPIVSGAMARSVSLPFCSPLTLPDSPPEGVEYMPLVTQPKRDGVWGVKNLQAYASQWEEQQYLSRLKTDEEGPFDLAVAAVKGDAKVVVVGSRGFAMDQVAFAREIGMGPQGLIVRSRNPGNAPLLMNSLHWLNDNEQFMDVGKPIDAAVLSIAKPSTERVVQAITIFVWPAMVLACGGVAWWVRRR